MRQAIGALAQEERQTKPQSANLTINHVIAAWLAAGSASQSLEDLKKEAEQRKPQQQAAPGPQSKNERPSHTHYFDDASGKILPVAS